jgi:hypothetical protein
MNPQVPLIKSSSPIPSLMIFLATIIHIVLILSNQVTLIRIKDQWLYYKFHLIGWVHSHLIQRGFNAHIYILLENAPPLIRVSVITHTWPCKNEHLARVCVLHNTSGCVSSFTRGCVLPNTKLPLVKWLVYVP